MWNASLPNFETYVRLEVVLFVISDLIYYVAFR